MSQNQANHIPKAAVWLLALFSSSLGFAQSSFQDHASLFTPPKAYVVGFTRQPPDIDGKPDDAAWQQAAWTEDFCDIEGGQKPKPPYRTRVKMLWSDSCLFIAAEMEEPQAWAYLKQHDAIIYQDNDFEVFIDPDNDTHHYFEVEVNARNTVLDLFLSKPYRNGGAALMAWDLAGLRSAVHIRGTLNDPSDQDTSWSVEMAIPFRSLFLGNQWRAPAEGALWRINFSRVQWETAIEGGQYRKKKSTDGKTLPENNWVWSPQGVVNMHYPERWGYLQFSKNNNNTGFVLPELEKYTACLWQVYYRQQAYRHRHGRFAADLQALDLPAAVLNDAAWPLTMEATSRQFTVCLANGAVLRCLNEEGLMQTLKPSP